MQRINRPVWRVVASFMFLLVVALLAIPAGADEETSTDAAVEPVVVDPSIQAVWDMTDGQIASGAVSRSWIFGPEPISAAHEYYPQSPTNFRQIVYYDKGRLDLNHEQLPPGSIWMVSGALLTSELMSGRIQLGENEFVTREPAEVPLVGDLEQPNPVTYATLAPHSSMASHLRETQGNRRAQRESSERHFEQVGKQVTALLRPDGSITPGAIKDFDVTITEYDELLGHNVASPFAGWASELPMPALNLVGLPISEPYWIETEVDGEPTLVLIQAFERRTLTFTPSNPEGWQVESGNVGLHYRLWRGLERPDRPELARMAAEIPFGEEVLKAARDHYIDPYIFAAISLNSTDGNPFAPAPNGGHGLLGAREEPQEANLSEDEAVDLNDPGLNADIAASQFAQQMYAAWDWPTILHDYFMAGGDGPQEVSSESVEQPSADEWVAAVLETVDQLETDYPPSGPRIDPDREHGKFVGEGRAAYYSPSYSVAWWEGAMVSHASWGNAVDDWTPDPNGFYCVHPDYLVGELLKLEANGRVLECTIGDRVAVPHQLAWRSRWAVEMSWPTFLALGLDRNNVVRVSYLGEREIPPPPTPDPSATPEPTVEPPDELPAQGRPQEDPPLPPTPTATPEPPPPATPTPQPEPSPTPDGPTATPAPEESATPTPVTDESASPTPSPDESATPTATPTDGEGDSQEPTSTGPPAAIVQPTAMGTEPE